MRGDWQTHLDRWTVAGVLDNSAADRIRDWERAHAGSQGLRWPILVALAFGALLLGAGVLLFVSAHWDELSTWQRMSLVLAMVAICHVAGAYTSGRFESLSIALHAVGTVVLGGGIALAGQIFHLSQHWPAAILLWGIGAGIAWLLLGHWTQAVLTAILVPWWLAGEWWVRMTEDGVYYSAPVVTGMCALSFAYLSARKSANDSALRRAFGWLGGIALLPSAGLAAAESWTNAPSWREQSVAWTIALTVPAIVAIFVRGRDALWTAVAIAWTGLLALINGGRADKIPVYLWCALGAIGLITWGIRESRAERINLGVAGFAITVLAFYFSSVMDKLGRSLSLIVLGILFLGGGWLLERTRRRLIAGLETSRT